METLRFARETDAPALLAIYAQYIRTPVTFEYELPTVETFAARIRSIAATYPYLVCEQAGRSVGYAYAHALRERAAYQWDAELSVYLDARATRCGAGTRLYRALLALLRLQGVRTAYAAVTAPNPASEALHRSFGFRSGGVQPNAGYKDGWHDMLWFDLPLGDFAGTPEPLLPVGALDAETVAAILRGDPAEA